MTENLEGVSTQDAPDESAGQAMPSMPTGSSAEVSSQPIGEDVGKAILERLDRVEAAVDEKRISDLVDARVKSDKDRRFDRVEREITDIRSVVEEAGGDFSLVEDRLVIQELQHRLDVLESGSGVAVGSGALSEEWQIAQVETDIILQSAGWAHDDPRYEAFKQKYANKVPADRWPGMVESLVTKIGKQETVSPALVAAEGGGSPPSGGGSEAALQKEYEERLAEIPQGDVAAIANLKAEYRKRGLPIW